MSLGGDSLSYVQASLGLEDILGTLPGGWARMTVAELGSLGDRRDTAVRAAAAPVHGRVNRASRVRRRRTIEMSVFLRAVATVLIVVSHVGLVFIPGGAHVLFAVAGFNFARFQLTPASRTARLRSQLRSILRVLVPSLVWIAAALYLTRDYELHNLFLFNSIVGPPPFTTEWHFWFVEVLIYILAGMAALLALPAVDRAERRWRFGVPMAVLAVGLAIRFGVLDLGVVQTRPALWLFALGWAASQATRGWQRGGILAVAAVALPGFFGDLGREVLIFVGIALLTLVRSISIPAWTAPLVGALASASLYVYLVHWQVYPQIYGWSQELAVLASLAAGLAAWKAAGWAGTLLGRVLRSLAGRWPVRAREGAAAPPTSSPAPYRLATR